MEYEDCIHWDVVGKGCPIFNEKGTCHRCEDYDTKYANYSIEDQRADEGDRKYHEDVTREEDE